MISEQDRNNHDSLIMTIINNTGEGLQEVPGLVLVSAVQGEQQEARQPRSEAQVLGSPHTPHLTILSHFVTLCHTMSHYGPLMSHYDPLMSHHTSLVYPV